MRPTLPPPFRRPRPVAAAVLGAVVALTTALPGASATAQTVAAPARTVRTTTSDPAALGARWLARQLDGRAHLRSSSGAADPSDTAQAVLALAASRAQIPAARRALAWLEANVRTDLTTQGSTHRVTDPGAVAFLVLDAHALGADPRSFGGVDLVTLLLQSERSDGLFGRADPTYDGAYRQGLALAALAAAGVRGTPAVTRAVAWLRTQQCASGGWEAYRASTATPCGPRDPSAYSGPDTNSTALAVEGLLAQGVRPLVRPRRFLLATQDSDGGWGYYGGPSDADSTAVVRQALVALHLAHLAALRQTGGTPASFLLGNQLPSGAEYYQAAVSTAPNDLATEQAVPALAQVALPVPPVPGA